MFSPGPACAALPRFLARLIRSGTCTLSRPGAEAEAVDQARADDDRTAALVAVRQDEFVQRDPRDARGRRRERRVFVEDRIGALAPGARADDARARCVDERLAASRERVEKGNDRALVIGAGRIDDDVGGSRGLRQSSASSSVPSTGSMPRARTASAFSLRANEARSPDGRRRRDGRQPIRRYSPTRPCRRFSLHATHRHCEPIDCARERQRRSNPSSRHADMDCLRFARNDDEVSLPQMLLEKLRRAAPGELRGLRDRAPTCRCSLTKACSAS